MTIKRLMLPASLIASGVVLAGFGSRGYLAAPAEQPKMERAGVTVRAKIPPSGEALRGRTRFVAVDTAADKGARAKAGAVAATTPPPPRKTVASPPPAKSPKRPQQAALDWPWNLFGR
jgi:hypothetical protein